MTRPGPLFFTLTGRFHMSPSRKDVSSFERVLVVLCCLFWFNVKLGSFFFLNSILIALFISPTAPQEKNCPLQ